MCGCGECATRKNVLDTCPMGNSKEAIQLWCSELSSMDDNLEDTLDITLEILEDIRLESEGVSL